MAVSEKITAIDEIRTATIPKFRDISGLGNTKVYQLINDGLLETVAVGSRRLVVLESWRRIVEQQRQNPVKLKLRGRK